MINDCFHSVSRLPNKYEYEYESVIITVLLYSVYYTYDTYNYCNIVYMYKGSPESSDRLVIISSKFNDKLTKLYTNCLHIILIVSVKYLRNNSISINTALIVFTAVSDDLNFSIHFLHFIVTNY